MENIKSILIDRFKKEAETLKDVVIDSFELDLTEDCTNMYWQVEHTINDLAEELEVELCSKDIIDDDFSVKDYLIEVDGLRECIFDILIKPVVNQLEGLGYDVTVDCFWETITVEIPQ